MADKKEFTVADMVYKNRSLVARGSSVYDVYESFISNKDTDDKGITLYIFNDGSKIEETKKLKLKKVKEK